MAIGTALLFVVLAAAYGNIIFLGDTLVSSADYSPIDDRFTHLRPGRVSGPAFLNWHDQGGVWWQWEPAGQFFGRNYRSGRVPTWDPTVAGGVDTHVNVTQAQYFLPYVMVLLAGNTPLERDVYHLLMLLASGVACFTLLRRNGFHRASSLFMGTAYMLGGAMTMNVSALIGQTYATLPFMILAVDVLLDRLSWRALGGAAIVVGLCSYSSFLPIVISGFVLIAIQACAYALGSLRPGQTDRVRPPRVSTILRPGADTPRPEPPSTRPRLEPGVALTQIAAFAAAAAGALGIAAFIMLPLGIAQHGNQFFESWYTGIGAMHYSLDLLPTLLSPRLFYDVYQTFPPATALIPKPSESTTHFFYAGFLVVMLVPLVTRDERPRVRRLTWFFALASVILFAKLMGVPPVQWIASLPVFKLLHFIPYWTGAFTLVLAGLAACGVEALIERGVTRGRMVAEALLAVALMALVVLFVYLKGINPGAIFGALVRYFMELGRILVVLTGLLTTLALRRRNSIGGPGAAMVVVALLAVELVPIAFHRRYQRADIWNDVPDYVRVLKRDPELFRIHSIQDPALPPNTFQGVGVSGISSLGVFNQPRYTLLIKKFFATQVNSGFILPSTLLPSSRNALDLLNVKYVLTHSPTPEHKAALAGAGLAEAAVDGNFIVYRNPRVWPRAYVAYDVRLVADASAALDALASLDGPATVVLEQRPAFAPAPEPATPCAIVAYEPNRIVIAGDTPRAGMLVLLDAFGPGWSATVNGASAAVLPANAAFRGVEVPAGHWETTLQYRSPFARAGLLVSLSTLGLAVVALLLPYGLPGAPRDADRPPRLPARSPVTGRPKDFGEILQLIYRELYSEDDIEELRKVWAVLVRDFFQHRIRDNATVVDVGAGPCLFINEVRAARRIAIDANPDTLNRAAPGVEVMNSLGSSLADLPDASVDHIFMSNFLEHLPTYREVLDILATAFEKLKPGGSLLILQPNYRLEPIRYFDPIDHTVVLTDRNLVLALKALSYRIDELRVRFLPFTTKSRVPKSPWLVALYLRLRPAQWLMGGQTFIKAVRPEAAEPDSHA